jgi:hypothetical protein
MIARFFTPILLFGSSFSFATGSNLAHDPLGRLTREEYADGTVVEHTLDVNGNILDTKLFKSVELTLQVDPPGAGTVTGAGRYRPNTTQALTATPGSAFDFINWKRPDGSIVSTNTNYTHSITGPEMLIATFAAIAPPVITTHPTNASPTSSNPLSLNVAATGRNPFTYSWKRNGQLLPDATATLHRPSPTFLDAGTYIAEVTNPGGVTRSEPALVTIPINSYTTWQSNIFTPAEITANNPQLIGPDATIGTDGMNNLLHYALGATSQTTSPANAYHMSSSGSPSFPTFEYNHLIGGGGLNYQVLTSNNLSTWDTTSSLTEQIGNPTANPDGITERIKVALKEPERSTWERAFFRLQVTQNRNPILFQDDFQASTLNAAFWNIEQGATVSVSDGIVSIASYPVWSKAINTEGKFSIQRQKFIIEWRAKRDTPYDTTLALTNIGFSNIIFIMDSAYNGTVPPGFRVSKAGAFGVTDYSYGSPTTEWMEYRATFNGTTLTCERGPTLDQITQSGTITLDSPIQNHNLFILLSNGGNNVASFDWIRVRE